MGNRKRIIMILCAVAAICAAAGFAALFFSNRPVSQPDPSDVTEIGTTLPQEETTALRSEDTLVFSEPSQQTVVSKESTFAFAGSCDGKLPLSCNGMQIPISENGLFTVEFVLGQGVNHFTFCYGTRTDEFFVEYGVDIVRAVGPQGLTAASSGMQVEILALAHKDAVLTARVGAAVIPMEATDRNAFTQSAGTKDYKTFVGVYTMPPAEASADLGEVTVTGTLNGETATMTGGTLRVLANAGEIAAEPQAVDPMQKYGSYYDGGTKGLLTPFSDHGRGSAMMCEVLKDKTETTPGYETADYSDPMFSPLCRGVFDYVNGMISYEDELMYVLASGRKIYVKDARLIPTGFILPENTLSADGVSSDSATTDFYIRTDWAVPTSFALSPQGYYTGHQGRRYNVTAFTAQYLDVTFYYTTGAAGSFSIPAGSVFSSMEWINNGNQSVTLRCYFAAGGKYYGAGLSLLSDGRYCLSVKKAAAQKTVILDPGHGGDRRWVFCSLNFLHVLHILSML